MSSPSLAGIVAVYLLAFAVAPLYGQDEAQATIIEVTTHELEQMTRCLDIARRFLAAANKGDLKAAKSLCAAKLDNDAPSSGDGDAVLGFESGRELRERWSHGKFRVQNIEYRRAVKGSHSYVLVWLHPTNGEWEGDLALVFNPVSLKIVSIFDAAE